MLRAVLLGLLSLSAVSCKSHDESQAKSQPGVAAGKVIEVTGTVTLHHGTETRPLAKGDMVDADDIVETGADGSAVIEVQHNNVNWEIGANKTGKMRESLAWTQPKKDNAAKATEEDSAAAGRHAERNAAESSATANERARESDAEEKKEEKAAAPKAKAAMAPRDESAPAPVTAAAPSAPTAPVVPPPAAQPAKGAAPAPGGASKNAIAPSASAASPPPPPPPKTVAKSRSVAPPSAGATADDFSEGGLGLTGTGAGGGGSAPDATSLVKAKQPQLTKCLKSAKTLRIKIEVDAAGKAKVIFIDKIDAADQDCVKKLIDSIKFPAQQAAISMALKA